jgi:predicted aconitase with swiveling domain
MQREFRGRVILAGAASGKALVTHAGFNSLAIFYESMIAGSNRAVCSDQNNPELYGKDLKDRIICLPRTSGSTSAGATWDTVATLKIAPKAMLFSQPIDSLGAAGLILADQWAGLRIITIDQLGEAFLEFVEEESLITIFQYGLVRVEKVIKSDTLKG